MIEFTEQNAFKFFFSCETSIPFLYIVILPFLFYIPFEQILLLVEGFWLSSQLRSSLVLVGALQKFLTYFEIPVDKYIGRLNS